MREPRCVTRLTKAISLGVISLLIVGQWSDLHAAQTPPNAGQAASPMKLNIMIVEGEGAINNVQQRVAREVIVQVDDENNRPIGGALVTFGLPTSGPGGSFANGANAFSVVTDASGRATATFTPNPVSGTFRMNVRAAFQGQTATTTVSQTNAAAAAAGATAAGAGGAAAGGVSVATVAVIAAAAAAAVAVGVVASKKGGGTSNPASGPGGSTIRIGSGTPTLGAPGSYAQSGLQAHPVPKWRE